MSKPPLPAAAVEMLRRTNPAVIATLRADGQPVSTPPGTCGRRTAVCSSTWTRDAYASRICAVIRV